MSEEAIAIDDKEAMPGEYIWMNTQKLKLMNEEQIKGDIVKLTTMCSELDGDQMTLFSASALNSMAALIKEQ